MEILRVAHQLHPLDPSPGSANSKALSVSVNISINTKVGKIELLSDADADAKTGNEPNLSSDADALLEIDLKGLFTVRVGFSFYISISVTLITTLNMGAASLWDFSISITLAVNRPVNLHCTHFSVMLTHKRQIPRTQWIGP